MFNKVLIANRGEIAVRIIRACRELGLRTVAVCSQADRSALHAQIADETICIGSAPSAESYLNIPAILSACSISGADAVHPGFGFLSENAAFAEACSRCGITFIGPKPETIDKMGNKSHAKQTMAACGVPVVPGSEGALNSLTEAKALAKKIGYPVLIKASAGGGGRGIRYVEKESQLELSFTTAKEEAKRFFGNDSVYLEKFVKSPRHVEIQIIADQHGNVVHLGERDCSIQRRNQKILEEAPCPSPLMTPALREAMGTAAVTAAKTVEYQNAGTIEFLLDAKGNFYFMEMNTRIQVEHPITEAVTGIDIVKTQLLVAMGKPLSFAQKDIQIRGHAIECRINAEDPKNNFRPCPGTLEGLYLPGGPGIRVDSAIYAGYTIPPYYDNMLAKLIAYAPTREEAIAKMKWALAEFIVQGVETTIEFQLEILKDKNFAVGKYDIAFLTDKIGKGKTRKGV